MRAAAASLQSTEGDRRGEAKTDFERNGLSKRQSATGSDASAPFFFLAPTSPSEPLIEATSEALKVTPGDPSLGAAAGSALSNLPPTQSLAQHSTSSHFLNDRQATTWPFDLSFDLPSQPVKDAIPLHAAPAVQDLLRRIILLGMTLPRP